MADRRRINNYGCGKNEWLSKASTSATLRSSSNKLCAYLSIEPVTDALPRNAPTRDSFATAGFNQTQQPLTSNNSQSPSTESQSSANESQMEFSESQELNVQDIQLYANDDSIILDGEEIEYGLIEYLDDEFNEPESPAFEPIVRKRTPCESIETETCKSVCDLNGITNSESFLDNTDFDSLRSHKLTTALVDMSFFNVHDDTIDQSLFGDGDALNISPQQGTGGRRMASDDR